MSTARDRLANPSINFPQTEAEAAQAVLRNARRVLFDGQFAPFGRTFAADAGFGLMRTERQVGWLTNQQAILAVLFEEFIDGLDVTKEKP